MTRPALPLLALCLVASTACSSGGGGGGAPMAGPAPGAPGSGSGAGTGSTPGAPSLAPVKTKTAVVIATSGAGFLEEDPGQGGRRTLHLKGTPYEMGVQYGEMGGPEIEGCVRAAESFVRQNGVPSFLVPGLIPIGASLFKPYFPQDAKDEIRGIVQGIRNKHPRLGVTEDDLYFMGAIVDLGAVFDLDFIASFIRINCSGIAVWGPIAKDGKTFQTRCVDLFTGSGLERYPLVVYYKPAGKVPYANVGWAGMTQVCSGMNAHGVAISQVWGFSTDTRLGQPWGMTMKRMLAEAWTSDDAVRTLRNEPNRTYGCNFVFADRGDGRGGAASGRTAESTPNLFADFTDDDPREDQALWNGQPYGIRIPNAVFRGDCALDPTVRRFQTASGGPGGDPRAAGAYQKRYKGQADRLMAYVNAGQPVGAEELKALARGVAIPDGSLQCVVYENTDLKIWAAYSRFDANGTAIDARDEPFYLYDFDYYQPTVDLVLDRSDYAPGDTQNLALSLSNLGSDRDLELRLEIQPATSSSMSWTYAQPAGTTAVSFRQGQMGSASVPATLPLLAPGAYRVVARLYERGTLDLVDVGVAAFSVR